MLALQKKKSLKLIISVSNSKIRVKKHEKLKARERIKEIIKCLWLQEIWLGGNVSHPEEFTNRKSTTEKEALFAGTAETK